MSMLAIVLKSASQSHARYCAPFAHLSKSNTYVNSLCLAQICATFHAHHARSIGVAWTQ